jgi:hypothetical protein
MKNERGFVFTYFTYVILFVIIILLWFFSHEATHNIICHLEGFQACTNFIGQYTHCDGIALNGSYVGKILYIIGPYILGLLIIFVIFNLRIKGNLNIALKMLPYAIFLDASETSIKFIMARPNSDITSLLSYFPNDIFPGIIFIILYIFIAFLLIINIQKYDMREITIYFKRILKK